LISKDTIIVTKTQSRTSELSYNRFSFSGIVSGKKKQKNVSSNHVRSGSWELNIVWYESTFYQLNQYILLICHFIH